MVQMTFIRYNNGIYSCHIFFLCLSHSSFNNETGPQKFPFYLTKYLFRYVLLSTNLSFINFMFYSLFIFIQNLNVASISLYIISSF